MCMRCAINSFTSRSVLPYYLFCCILVHVRYTLLCIFKTNSIRIVKWLPLVGLEFKTWIAKNESRCERIEAKNLRNDFVNA